MKKALSSLFAVMLVLPLALSSCIVNIPGESKENPALTLEEIRQLEDDPLALVIEMYMYLCEKCKYGDNMEALSDAERTFYIVQEVEGEVNNGGFAQFFWNSSGNLSSEVVSAMKSVGADKTAEICIKAIDAFESDIPTDRSERQEMMDAASEKTYELLEACEYEFFTCTEDLTDLCFDYIMQNKADFS